MFIQPHNRLLAVSQKIYGWLLHAYPRAHRQAYGAAMAQLFCDQCRDAWEQARGWGMFKLWLRVVPDLVSTSIAEQIAALNPRKSMPTKLAGLSRFHPATPRSVFGAVFIAVFLMVFMTCAIVTFLLPDTYASKARLKVSPDNTRGQGIGNPNYDPYFMETVCETMGSEAILTPVIKELDLSAKWGLKYNNGAPLQSGNTLEILQKRLVVKPVAKSQLVEITVYSADNQETAQIANAITHSFEEYAAQADQKINEAKMTPLVDRIRTLRAELAEVRTAMNSAGSAEAVSANKQKLDHLETELTTLKAEDMYAQTNIVLPFASVAFVDIAQPGRAPVKPNRPVNIIIGGFIGIFLAAIVGAIAMLVAFLFKKKNPVVAPA